MLNVFINNFVAILGQVLPEAPKPKALESK